MTTILMILLGMAMAAGGFCVFYWVPMGDPEKCRIIRSNGKETGEVRDTGGFVFPFNGWLSDFTETDRRFTVDVPSFLAGFPNDEGASTSVTLIFEVANDGGAAFVKNGRIDGVSAKVVNIAKAAVLNFGQSTKEGPMSVDEAQKEPEEFILRVADAFAAEELVERAAGMMTDDRREFVKNLAGKLSDVEGNHRVTKFGLMLVGVMMTNFVESTKVTEATEARKAAAIKNEQDLAEIAALTAQRNKLVEGHADVSFKDADRALAIWKKVIPLTASEHVVRIDADQNAGAAEKIIGGVIAAFGEKNKGGNKK